MPGGFFTPGACGCCVCQCADADRLYAIRGVQRRVRVEISGLPSSILRTDARDTGLGIAFVLDYEITGLDSVNGTHFIDLPTITNGCLTDADSWSTSDIIGTINAGGTSYNYNNLSACSPSGTTVIDDTRNIILFASMSGNDIQVQINTGGFAFTTDPRFGGCQVLKCADGFDSSINYAAPGGNNPFAPFQDKPCDTGHIWYKAGGLNPPGQVRCGFPITEALDVVVGAIKATLV